MTANRSNPEPVDDGGRPQAHKARRLIWWGGAGVALLVVMVVYVNLGQSRPLQISKETTYLTEPLKSDGKQVDYFAAIRQATRPDNAATDENGYRLIVRHLGRGPDTTPEHFARICEDLGLDPRAVRPDIQYQESYEFLKSYVESDQFDKALVDRLFPDERSRDDAAWMLGNRLQRPWTLDELPMMAAWLEQNGPALDLIGRAVRQPTFHIPLVRQNENEPLIGILLPELPRMRSLARGLTERANHRVAIGNIDGAIDDVIACKRLGRHVGHGPFLVDLLVGMTLEGMADALGIAGSLGHPPTTEQLERLLADMDVLPPETMADDAIALERYFGLDLIQSVSHGKGSWAELVGSLNGPPAGVLTKLSVDWNTLARRFNELFDETLATGEPPRPMELTPGNAIRLVSVRARSEVLGEILASLLCAVQDSIVEATWRRDCLGQTQRITLAMLLYERDHGTLPPAWSADAAGNPLHSWRVLLLPYLGERELYERIRLDEPWDSEHNRQFHGEAVAFYRCPSHPEAALGQTTYSVVVGPDMPFGAGEGKRLSDFGPHSDDMILVAERTDPVGWMDPAREVTQADAEQGICDERTFPSPGRGRIGSYHPGTANVGLRNGAVRALSTVIDGEVFRKLLRGTNADETLNY